MGREVGLIIFIIFAVFGTIVIAWLYSAFIRDRKKWMNYVADDFDGVVLIYIPKKKKVEFVSDSLSWKFDIKKDEVCRNVESLFEALDISLDDDLVRDFCEGVHPLSKQREYTVTGARKQEIYHIRIKTTPCGRGRYLLTIADWTAEYERSKTLDIVVEALEYENQSPLFLSVFEELSESAQDMKDVFEMSVKQLLNRLTEFARADLPLKKEAFSLRDLMREVVDLTSYQVRMSRQRLEIKVSIIEERLIGDEEMLRLVMCNILKNAVLYTQEGGTIVLMVNEARKDEGKVRVKIVVKDNGIGIDEEFMPRLFQPLQRSSNPQVRKMNGYGLGLATVKKLVDAMGGTIAVTSTSGEGTSIVVSLEFELAEEDE